MQGGKQHRVSDFFCSAVSEEPVLWQDCGGGGSG